VFPKSVAEAPQGGVRVKLGVTDRVGVFDGKGEGVIVGVLVIVRVWVRVAVFVWVRVLVGVDCAQVGGLAANPIKTSPIPGKIRLIKPFRCCGNIGFLTAQKVKTE